MPFETILYLTIQIIARNESWNIKTNIAVVAFLLMYITINPAVTLFANHKEENIVLAIKFMIISCTLTRN